MTQNYYSGEFLVWGPPGTGKTTFLARQVGKVWERAAAYDPGNRTPCLVCSLTRAAAAEVAGRKTPLPREAIGTLHSHAYRALGAPGLAEEHVAEFNEARPDMRLSAVLEPDTDGDGDNPGWDRQGQQATAADVGYELYHLLRARQVPRTQWAARVQAFAAAWEHWKNERGLVDFSDMVELCVRDNVPPVNADGGLGNKPGVIIADEVQDHSALEYTLLRRWGGWAGALIVTGDPYQALYTWRGADPGIFLRPDLPDDRRRVLSQSYRVPRAVHDYAMRWVRTLSDYQPLDYKPRDADGSVGTCGATWKGPQRAVADAQQHLADGRSVLFLTSCSYQLAPLLKTLRQRGIPFSNPWRRKRGDWNPLGSRRGTTMGRRLCSFLRPDPRVYDDARLWTYDELAQWALMLKSKGVLRHGMKAQIKQRTEKTDAHNPEAVMLDWEIARVFEADTAALLADMARGTGKTPAELLQWLGDHLTAAKQPAFRYPAEIARQFGPRALEAEPTCHVGTIHSVKGGEADVVYLFPDLSPSGAREWHAGGVHRDSVVRLFYVGATRARQRLVVCEAATQSSVNLMAYVE